MWYNILLSNTLEDILQKLSLLDKAHARLATLQEHIKDTFIYDEESPTCLRWKNEFRVGNKGVLTRRVSTVAGGISPDKERNVITINKSPYTVAKVIWVMHFGAIPIGYSVFHKDDNSFNTKISNLYVRSTELSLPEKYSNVIKEYLKYDETSPSHLRWIRRTSAGSFVKPGDVAGSLDKLDGYWKLHGLGHHYKVARLIWFLHHGKIPDGYSVDHIDRNRQNNNISNLRVVPPVINGRNRSMNSNNSTGVNGISYGEFFNENGTLIRRYVVTLRCGSKKFHRSFSLEKYGDERAWTLALEAKARIVNQLSEEGAGFTEDHGT